MSDGEGVRVGDDHQVVAAGQGHISKCQGNGSRQLPAREVDGLVAPVEQLDVLGGKVLGLQDLGVGIVHDLVDHERRSTNRADGRRANRKRQE